MLRIRDLAATRTRHGYFRIYILLRREPFNGRLQDECLNTRWFLSLQDARTKIEAWRGDYNESRPHTSPGWLTPVEYAAAAATIAVE